MSDERGTCVILPNATVLAEQAAEDFVREAQTAIEERERFSVALAGGTTPRRMYELLTQAVYRDRVDWNNVHVFWSDERYVPPDDAESNFRLAREALLDHVPIPAANIYLMPTVGSTPEAAAQAYQATLTAFFGNMPRFDLILLGMGPDGHTASLFPGKPEVTMSSDALVIAVHDAPKPPPDRLSFTLRLINAAAHVLFLVAGADKASALRRVLEDPIDPLQLPAQGVHPSNGTLTWLLDAAAAQELHA